MKFLPWLLLATAAHAVEPITLKLWPDGAPGKMLPHSQATGQFIEERSNANTVSYISDPVIEVYRPDLPARASVIVAPGGAYAFLSAVHEGTQVCEWLNSLCITAVLLKYRTPTRDEVAPHEKPVQDAAKAIALVREHAQEWKLDPNRVGLLGFSAGGNLLAHLACDRHRSRRPIHADELPLGHPNFGIMIYGGGFVDSKDPSKFKEGFSVPADAPPMFLACAHDDGQNSTAATVLYLDYKKLGIPCELHLFALGGHGFGMRDNHKPINAWPKRCADWMESMGWLTPVDKIQAAIVRCNAQIAEMDEQAQRVYLFATQTDSDSEDRLAVLIDELAQKIRVQPSNVGDEELRGMQKKLKELTDFQNEVFAEEDKIREKRRLHILELSKLTKKKAELEAERDRLLQSPSKAKSP